MSIKSLIQTIILLVIFVILGGVYLKYFSFKETVTVSEEANKLQNKKDLSNSDIITSKSNNVSNNIENVKKIPNEDIKNQKITNKSVKSKIEVENKVKNNLVKLNEKNKIKENKVKNLVKDVEYLTTDKNGNKYKILATSGKTNLKDNNILDLNNVRGIIISDERSNIYIVSDFAEYNSSNLNSKFYQNVIINYEDKKITCDNLHIDMETNTAIAYNNVVITDPKSILKAGKIALDIETKDININPNNKKSKVIVVTN